MKKDEVNYPVRMNSTTSVGVNYLGITPFSSTVGMQRPLWNESMSWNSLAAYATGTESVTPLMLPL